MINYEAWAWKHNFHSPTVERIVRKLRPRWFIRPMIQYLKDNYNYPLVGVEIGVLKGDNAKLILKELDIDVLHLIDPTLSEDLPHSFFQKYYYKIVDHPVKSKYAVNSIPNELDFVYIDGDHSYEAVSKDITLYYPKVRKGGVIGGHDIKNLAVYNAVMDSIPEFTMCPSELNIKVNDWWVVK